MCQSIIIASLKSKSLTSKRALQTVKGFNRNPTAVLANAPEMRFPRLFNLENSDDDFPFEVWFGKNNPVVIM